MFTSNFARIKRLPAELRPVSISIKPPYWYRKDKELQLAPTVAMLGMTAEEYNIEYDAILAKLDPKDIFESLGDNAVLLCFESPNVCCHRRRVAEWFETSLGIVVPEYGFERHEILAYLDQPSKLK